MTLLLRYVKVIVVNLAQLPVDIQHQKILLPLPQQQALQKNQILVLELENLTLERRENTKKPTLNMDLRIPLSTVSSTLNVWFAPKYWQMIA
jgi:hypothetical protein